MKRYGLLFFAFMLACGTGHTESIFLQQDRIAAKMKAAGYEVVGDYSEGFIAVKKGGKRTYVDSNGKELLPAQFDDLGPFRGGYAYVERDGVPGLIDKNGKQIFQPNADWSFIGDVHDGLVSVDTKGGKSGFVNLKGETVIPFEYERLLQFEQGVSIATKDGMMGLIDRQNKTIAAFEYDLINYFAEGSNVTTAKKGGLWCILKTDGNLVHPATMDYTTMTPFYGGLAVATSGELHGYVDATGKEIQPVQYEHAGPMNKWGHATVTKDGETYMIDKAGAKLFSGKGYAGIEQVDADMYRVTAGDETALSGMVTATGAILWPMKYFNIVPMERGLFSVSLDEGNVNYYANAKGEKVAEKR